MSGSKQLLTKIKKVKQKMGEIDNVHYRLEVKRSGPKWYKMGDAGRIPIDIAPIIKGKRNIKVNRIRGNVL
jgi:DNA polymerase elongation subunit (family B)